MAINYKNCSSKFDSRVFFSKVEKCQKDEPISLARDYAYAYLHWRHGVLYTMSHCQRMTMTMPICTGAMEYCRLLWSTSYCHHRV